MHNRTWFLPVTKSDIISSDRTCIAQDREKQTHGDADDLPQCEPIFQFTVDDDAEEGDRLVEEPGQQDPAVCWHFVRPVCQDDRDEVVLRCDIASPLNSVNFMFGKAEDSCSPGTSSSNLKRLLRQGR